MLQITENTAIVSDHDVPFTTTTETPPVTAIAPPSRIEQYENLLARILDSIENTVFWSLNLSKELREMKETKLYEVQFESWDQFCRNLHIPGFQGKSGRYADMLIADGVKKEQWKESELLTPIIDSVLKLPESVTRELGRAPAEDQPELVSKLITEGRPTAKRAKELVEEESAPSLEWLISQWEQVGEITRMNKYPNGFYVHNPVHHWIDFDFQNRASAWKLWQEKGDEYLETVKNYKRRQEIRAAKLAEAKPPTVEPDAPATPVAATIEPNSCFGCLHHERNLTGGFDCKARSLTMALGDDYGPDCRFWKHDGQTLFEVAEFSLRNKPWAKGDKVERPFKQELELLGLVLDALVEERLMLEGVGKSGEIKPVSDRIAHIGQSLQALIQG